MSILSRMDTLISQIDSIASSDVHLEPKKHQEHKPEVGTHSIQIKDATKYIGQMVELRGWIQDIRKSKQRWFIDLRDGTYDLPLSHLQCVLEADIFKSDKASLLTHEISIKISGKIVPHKTTIRDQRTVELQTAHFEIIGLAPSSFKCKLDDIGQHDFKSQLDQRHLMIRQQRLSTMLRIRYYITKTFRDYFDSKDFIEITPPTLVQTQTEGGSELFKVQYFEQDSYLTQTSQLYLESCCPSLGKVYSIMPSYRAEKSRTRRHLAEYTHIEAEIPFIKFDDLLDILEEMIVYICKTIKTKHGDLIKYGRKLQSTEWPKCKEEKTTEIEDFFIPKTPFKRMTHEEAIIYCRKHDIKKGLVDKDGRKILDKDGKQIMVPLEFGEDIPEGPEREMTDKIGEPIFLIKFPAKIKSFYMSRCIDDGREDLTESVDLLMPCVGEIIGGSMREFDYVKMMKAFQDSDDIKDISKYYWYQDLRKYGSVPHGGFGLGLERFLCWILRIYHIRDATLYPRFIGRCTP